MAEVNFPSNSFSSRQDMGPRYPNSDKPEQREKPRQTRVVKGKVIKRKKSAFKQLISTFVYEDGANLGSYIVNDIIIPKVKDLLYDIVTGGTDRALYGSGSNRSARQGYTSYGRYYSPGSGVSTVSYGSSTTSSSTNKSGISSIRTGASVDDIMFDSRAEAEDVLADMLQIIEEYGSASIMDLYDLVGCGSSYTDTQYGWFNLGSATVRHTRDGYMIVFPRTQYLN